MLGLKTCFLSLFVIVNNVNAGTKRSIYIKANVLDPKILRGVASVPTCGDKEVKEKCSTKCDENYVCFFGQCQCINQDDDDLRTKTRMGIKHNKQIPSTLLSPYLDFIKKPEEKKFLEYEDLAAALMTLTPEHNVPEKDALRHHIAHFCPDLDEARECIRSCMKVGKPAFCGKDHVCYCGHKYDHNKPDKKANVTDMYAQFHDLYEKYFGKLQDDNEEEQYNDYSEENGQKKSTDTGENSIIQQSDGKTDDGEIKNEKSEETKEEEKLADTGNEETKQSGEKEADAKDAEESPPADGEGGEEKGEANNEENNEENKEK